MHTFLKMGLVRECYACLAHKCTCTTVPHVRQWTPPNIGDYILSRARAQHLRVLANSSKRSSPQAQRPHDHARFAAERTPTPRRTRGKGKAVQGEARCFPAPASALHFCSYQWGGWLILSNRKTEHRPPPPPKLQHVFFFPSI